MNKFKVGDKVLYSSVIGRKDDGITRYVTALREFDGPDMVECVYWVTGKLGFVTEDALSKAPIGIDELSEIAEAAFEFVTAVNDRDIFYNALRNTLIAAGYPVDTEAK